MTRFLCPYLDDEVELSQERERHITERHPDFLPTHRARLGETLHAPDEIRRSAHAATARLFSRCYDDLSGRGSYVVVVVVSDVGARRRHWIVTGYIARTLAQGEVEWSRD